ncbi:MAG TPA: saccharopine dehydrogenase NADP-binding domain-containing protein [Solirubrobacteraceae bacterium]|nr:saccharopine dehydrogenase NADP-binding domain-containing protein [Solirubrobacteraceae bacterium]
MTSRSLSVAVLGAAGTIAPAIIRDLAASDEIAAMTLLDLDGDRAAAAATEHGSAKARGAAVDARDHDALSTALAGADVLINTASYRVNLDAMSACLSAGCHYLDLGGLYWVTREQLELDPEFRRAGLLAVLGIGSSPGKTNLMARRAVDQLGVPARTIEVVAGGRDPAAPDDGRLRPPYAVQTLVDELTLRPVLLRGGEPVEIDALTPGGAVDFGDPIGVGETIYTLHSELVTFGSSFGASEVSFRLSLAPALLERLTALATATPDELAAAARQAASPSTQTVSVHLVNAYAGDGTAVQVRAETSPHFGLGGSIVSTAAPIAAATRLMARGLVTDTGALGPEACLDSAAMFAELQTRGCAFSTRAL